MNKDIEEIKSIIDILTIESALNTAHLKTLTIAFHEITSQLLKADEFRNLQSNYYIPYTRKVLKY